LENPDQISPKLLNQAYYLFVNTRYFTQKMNSGTDGSFLKKHSFSSTYQLSVLKGAAGNPSVL
jgi:hypothetical protein